MNRLKKLKATDVADYILLLAKKEGVNVTNKKLQKVLYYTQSWSLVLRDKKIFEDKIEAWVHGPAIREVYVEYKKYGFGPITKRVHEDSIILNKDQKELVDIVWKIYGKRDPAYLEQLSHSEEPWQTAREGLAPHIGSENEITIESMKEFYKKKLEEAS